LFEFDRGLLDGYGERPEHASAKTDWWIYLGAVIAVPVVYFLFTNLMNSSASSAEAHTIGEYILSLPIMGKALFFTFLVSIPGILAWSWFAGSRQEFQMM